MTAEGSYFLELPILDPSSNELRNQLPGTLHLEYISHTPPVALPGERRFYFLRPHARDAQNIEDSGFFRECLIGRSWDEIANKPYRFRDHILQASVARLEFEGSRRVPLVEMKSTDTLLETVAYPPGVFAGDEVPTFLISALPPLQAATERTKKQLKLELARIKTSIHGSNSLTPDQRLHLEAALEECDREAGKRSVDHRRIASILSGARTFALKVGQSLIAKAIWAGLAWLWKHWPSLPF